MMSNELGIKTGVVNKTIKFLLLTFKTKHFKTNI